MSQPRRVLLVHPFAQPISGPDRSILAVMERLVPQGWRYDVVLPGESPFAPAYEALGCRIFRYPMSIIKRRLDPRFLAGYAWRFAPTVAFLRRVIREVTPDLVHTNGAVLLGGGLAARLCGVPSVTHVRCTAIAHPRWVAAGIVRTIAATSRRVICISEACARPFRERGFDRLVRVIPNGIEIEPFRACTDDQYWRRELGLPPETPLVGQVGRLGPDKGWLEFVALCAGVHAAEPRAHFVAVGAPHTEREQAYAEAVRARVAAAGLEGCFHFAGQRDTMPAVMRGLDVVVSQAREEGLGRVAIEAMAAGRPVVAANVHGLREVVRHEETGLLVPPEDPAAGAAAVLGLLRDPPRRQRLGAAGADRAAARFTAAGCAEATAALYHDVLETP
jgi:glycosyltransferase involved in cell wall biosynthesis